MTHLQLAESTWTPPKQRSEVRIVSNGGRADAPPTAERWRQLAHSILKKCSPPELVAQNPQWRLLDTWPCGALSVLEAVWQRLGIPDVIAAQLAQSPVDLARERALFALVANRACAPSSQRYCSAPGVREDVRLDGTAPLALHPLYRAREVLEAHQEAMEHARYVRLADLRNVDVVLSCYETTSRHFEIDESDQGHGDDERVAGSLAAGSQTYKALRKRGLAKHGRSAAPPIVSGLAVTRAGLPGRHGVWPGKPVEVSTVAQGQDDVRGGKLRRGVWGGEAGLVSQDNLDRRSTSGGKSILCLPRRRGDEVTHEVLQRPGRSQQVADTRRVKEGVVGEGERRRRSVVGHNPPEETRPRAQRRQVLRELEAAVAARHQRRGAGQSNRGCQLRSSRRYGRYLRLTKGGVLRIDAAKRHSEAQLDGTLVVHSNDDSLSPAALALGYQQLPRVEEAWRTLKSGLRVRPG